jgi:hypothetical protein
VRKALWGTELALDAFEDAISLKCPFHEQSCRNWDGASYALITR